MPLPTSIKSAALLCLLALATGAHASDQPLRIGWVYAMANAPAPIAQQQGFYAAQGLKVELKAFTDGPLLEQAVAAGEIDAAYVGSPPVYQWFSRGLESKIIAKVSYGQAALIAGKDQSIQNPADLPGKRVASVAKGSGMDVLLRGFVLKDTAKLDPERDVSIVTMPPGNMNAALDRDVVNAAFSWEPFVSQAVLRGSARVVLDLNKVLPNYPSYVIAAVPKTLRERPEDIQKLLRANIQAIDFLNHHPDEADRLIVQTFKLDAVQGPDGKPVPAEAIVRQARTRLGWSAQLSAADQQFMQRMMDYSLALGFMGKPLKVAQVVDASYVHPDGK